MYLREYKEKKQNKVIDIKAKTITIQMRLILESKFKKHIKLIKRILIKYKITKMSMKLDTQPNLIRCTVSNKV